MAEYIDREVAKKYLASDYAYSAANLLDDLPAENVVEVKQGAWLSEPCNHVPHRYKHPEKWLKYHCSICGKSNGRKRSKYCPNCGAEMKLEDKNDER